MLKEIQEWKSTRRFKGDAVPKEVLHGIMQAGRRAPSWKNIQPWKFIAVTHEGDRKQLSEIFSMGVLIKKAPAVILCVATLESWYKEHQRDRLRELIVNAGASMSDAEIDKLYLDHELARSLAQDAKALVARTLENMGIAYGFMIVEALHQGLGACIIGETENNLLGIDQEKYQGVKNYFNLKETEIITGAIILGYPAKENSISPRKPEDEIIFFHRDI